MSRFTEAPIISRNRLLPLSLVFVFFLGLVPAAHAQECGDVTFEGECQETSVVWCEEDTLYSVDCAEIDGTCGWDLEQELYDCLGCLGESFEGRCGETGETVIWCEDETPYEADCSLVDELDGGICGYDCAGGGYSCVAPQDFVSGPSACDDGSPDVAPDVLGGDPTEPAVEADSGGSDGCAGGSSSRGWLWVLAALAIVQRRWS